MLLLRIAIISLLLPFLGSDSYLTAQNRLWRAAKASQLTEFDFSCAETSWHPSQRLTNIVQAALRRTDDGPPRYADRAFAFDLNGDLLSELFVPLTCGATGNCSWAILATKPPRLLGLVGGENLYLHRTRGGWPVIVTYTHVTAGEGYVMTYRVQRGRYVSVAKPYAINHTNFDMDVQRGRGHKFPVFLERAREACGTVGY